LLHAKGNKLVIVDEGQHLRAVAALKVGRLVVGAFHVPGISIWNKDCLHVGQGLI